MRVFGIDFTSAPSPKKPITCAEAKYDGQQLRIERITHWASFEGFDELLAGSGPWIAGMDFPFAQSRRLVENIGWPTQWESYVDLVGNMTKGEFREALVAYRTPRKPGDKHHKRCCDKLSRSQSPQTIDYTPVGLMFFEGAPRLMRSKVHLPHLRDGDGERIVLEAYPGVAARSLIGKTSYKNDQPKKQTRARLLARREILEQLLGDKCSEIYGFSLRAPIGVAEDPTGDELDAVLCAIQAAWGWSRRDERFGAPSNYDRLEGWICDPSLLVDA